MTFRFSAGDKLVIHGDRYEVISLWYFLSPGYVLVQDGQRDQEEWCAEVVDREAVRITSLRRRALDLG